jgi:hypothetical protein
MADVAFVPPDVLHALEIGSGGIVQVAVAQLGNLPLFRFPELEDLDRVRLRGDSYGLLPADQLVGGDGRKDRILPLGGFFQLVNEFVPGRRRGEELISLARAFIPSGDVGFLAVGLVIGVYSHGDFNLPE